MMNPLMNTFAFFGMPGHYELIIFLVIALLLFGKRLPSTMFSVGKSLTEFKRGMKDELPEAEQDVPEEKAEKKAE